MDRANCQVHILTFELFCSIPPVVFADSKHDSGKMSASKPRDTEVFTITLRAHVSRAVHDDISGCSWYSTLGTSPASHCMYYPSKIKLFFKFIIYMLLQVVWNIGMYIEDQSFTVMLPWKMEQKRCCRNKCNCCWRTYSTIITRNYIVELGYRTIQTILVIFVENYLCTSCTGSL